MERDRYHEKVEAGWRKKNEERERERGEKERERGEEREKLPIDFLFNVVRSATIINFNFVTTNVVIICLILEHCVCIECVNELAVCTNMPCGCFVSFCLLAKSRKVFSSLLQVLIFLLRPSTIGSCIVGMACLTNRE